MERSVVEQETWVVDQGPSQILSSSQSTVFDLIGTQFHRAFQITKSGIFRQWRFSLGQRLLQLGDFGVLR